MSASVEGDTSGLRLIRTLPGQARPADPVVGLRRDRLHDRHVLVVGVHYAPEPIGAGPCTTGLAEHLATRAASVTVLSGVPHYPAWQRDERYRGHRLLIQQPGNGAGPTVVRLGHHVPTRRTALDRARYETSFARQAATARLPRRPDLVIGVTPSAGGAAAAARISRRYGVPLVIVVQELAGSRADSAEPSAGRLARRLESYALRRADRVAVSNRTLTAAVAARGVPEERIGLVPSWSRSEPTAQARQDARERLGWDRQAFVAVHLQGSPERQDLATVAEAAQHLPSSALVVVTAPADRREELRSPADDVPNLVLLDPADTERYALALTAADVLLLGEREGAADTPSASELDQHLGSGRAFVVAAMPGGPTAETLRRTGGAGLVVRPGQPLLLACAILELRADRDLCAAMGRRAAAYARSTLGRPAAMAALDGLVDGLLDELATAHP